MQTYGLNTVFAFTFVAPMYVPDAASRGGLRRIETIVSNRRYSQPNAPFSRTDDNLKRAKRMRAFTRKANALPKAPK
jgi:hypothetical protein